MTRAVVFDWGGVLMRTVDIRPRLAWEHRLGLAFTGLEDLFFRSSLWTQTQRGQASLEDVWTEVGTELGLDSQDLTALSRDFWAGDQLDQEMVSLIKELRTEGVRVALLSNFASDLQQMLTDLGLDDLFEVVFISGLEGAMKPDPAVYQATLDRLGVPATEAIFVDDLQVNVEGAKQVGMTGIRFRGTRHLRRALVDSGLPLDALPPTSVPAVRAIIFDWGGVISPMTFARYTEEWETQLGLAPGTLHQVMWGLKWKDLEVGAIPQQAYDDHVAQELGLPDQEAVHQFYDGYFGKDYLDQKVVEAVRSLRDRYKAAMLTNAFAGHAKMMVDRYGYDPQAEFDVYVNSALVKLAKPDPAIYQLTLEQLDVAPAEAVFLDDQVRNIDAAQALGIHGVVFADSDSGLTELEGLLGHAILPK